MLITAKRRDKVNKKYNMFEILLKVHKQTLNAAPLSGIIGILNYLLQGLSPAISAIILAQLFDNAYKIYSKGNEDNNITAYAIAIIILYSAIFIFRFVSNITINAGVYERCTSYYKMKIAEKAIRIPLISFEDTNILNLRKRANECVEREILSQIYMSSTTFIINGVNVISTVIVLFTYNKIFIVISIISILPYFISRYIRGKEFYHLKKIQTPMMRKLEYLWNLFSDKQAIKEMRVMGFEQYIAEKWSNVRDEVSEELWEQSIKDNKSLLVCDIIKTIGYCISILLSFHLVITGRISVGMFGACIAAFKSMQEATKNFLIDLGNMPEKVSFANDYFEFLDLEEFEDGDIVMKELNDAITLESVYFAYPNADGNALTDISLTIHKGETVVILGANGSGKTTLVKILLNTYSPNRGKVKYDFVDSSNICSESIYNMFSIVPQEFMAYQLTLRENIAISNLEHMCEDNLIQEILNEVGLCELKKMELEQQLGRDFGGVELSGGQWQKIAIARGLYKQSDVIILDEPTSALDPLIETEVLKQFVDVTKNKTAIIISHRVGLCKLADKVIVMKNGEIVECGTHNELIKKNGEYKKLYFAQEKWYNLEVGDFD
jgi:ABC-type multidrug transport system fused ATPase/permease subunit